MSQPADYSTFQIGNAKYPIATAGALGGTSLLQRADPALFYALDFWSFVIDYYCGDALLEAFAAAGVTASPGIAISKAVAQSYPYAPLPEYLENQIAFPALFAYRTDIRTEWHSVGYEFDIVSLEVVYVLPPLDAQGSEKVLPILTAVEKALRRKTTDAWDPAYAPPGGPLGAQFDSAPFGHVAEIGFGEYSTTRRESAMGEHGFLEHAGDQFFPCLKLKAYIIERDNYYPAGPSGPSKFAGSDITGNVLASDGTKVAPFVQVSTQQAPKISSIYPANGPVAGGTAVTIRGSLFLSGPPVVFFGPPTGPQYATSATFVSDDEVQVVTPAMSGPGTVAVSLTNRDGQTATLSQAFTFQ